MLRRKIRTGKYRIECLTTNSPIYIYRSVFSDSLYTRGAAAVSSRPRLRRPRHPFRPLGVWPSGHRGVRPICRNAVDPCWLGGHSFNRSYFCELQQMALGVCIAPRIHCACSFCNRKPLVVGRHCCCCIASTGVTNRHFCTSQVE